MNHRTPSRWSALLLALLFSFWSLGRTARFTREQLSAFTNDCLAPTATIILVAVGLAILGGLLAGAIGGWRAARLRPAEALRSVA